MTSVLQRTRWIILLAATALSLGVASAWAEGWVARHGMTAQTYQKAFDSYVSQGYRLVDISAYSVQGKPRFAGVWWQQDPAAPLDNEAGDGLAAQGLQYGRPG